MKKTTQLYVISPEELENTISNSIENAFKRYSKKLNKSKKQKDWMSRKEVSAMLGVSLVTLSTWTKQKILPSYKISGQVRYIRDEVELALTKIT